MNEKKIEEKFALVGQIRSVLCWGVALRGIKIEKKKTSIRDDIRTMKEVYVCAG